MPWGSAPFACHRQARQSYNKEAGQACLTQGLGFRNDQGFKLGAVGVEMKRLRTSIEPVQDPPRAWSPGNLHSTLELMGTTPSGA